jgi:hypothetical protein
MDDGSRQLPGSKPIGLAIGVAVLMVLGLLPFLIVVLFYLFANVDAIVTGTRFGSGTLNVGVFLTGLVLTVALLLVGLSALVGLLGRALSPKRS